LISADGSTRSVPRLLLVGAAGRNAGKTELAATVIRTLSAHTDVVGVKVTTVHERNGLCPRGGVGCGVCSALDEPWVITEESLPLPGAAPKDTQRLLLAGARQVLWLRVVAEALADGAAALLDRLPPGLPVVCESNSLRRVVEPGLFVVVRRAGSRKTKPSCREVLHHADVEITSDGSTFDLPPTELTLVDGRWTFPRHATAIVLAGGRSSRMGRDKALLPVGGQPLIAHVVAQLRPHFAQILVSAGEEGAYAFLGLPVVADREAGLGPMMAVASALEASAHQVNVVVPCDTGAIHLPLLFRILREARADVDVVVPVTHEGHYEPLFAAYHRRALEVLDDELSQGRRRLVGAYRHLRVRQLHLAPGQEPGNLNTLEDYHALVHSS